MATNKPSFWQVISLVSLGVFIIDKTKAQTSDCDTPCQYIRKYYPYAQSTQTLYQMPALFTIAQAGLETGWGISDLAKNANNHFGIKADASWNGPVYNGYRKYDSVQQSFDDHGKYLVQNNRYDNAFSNLEPFAFAQQIANDGYSEKPGYANSLINTMNTAKKVIG